MKLIDNQKRSTLSEGRNYGMGFGFLKKTGEDEYTTVTPISACKDYLNDVVYSESLGESCSAYGLAYTKQSIFDGKESYLAIKILPYNRGNDYPNQKKDTENLKANYKLLEKFINSVEDKLKLDVKTSIKEVDNDTYILTFDYFWCKYTYLISLYTLLLRCGQFFKDDKSPEEFIEKFSEFQPDIYLLNDAKVKLKKMYEGNIPEQKFTKEFKNSSIHNCGIVGFKFN